MRCTSCATAPSSATAALEAGLEHDPSTGELVDLVDVYGSWPDDAWLVWTHFDIPPLHVTVYHWQRNRWLPVAPERRPFAGVRDLLPWGKGGALALDAGSVMPYAALLGVGARAGRVLGPPETIFAVAAFEEGVIVGAVAPPEGFEASTLRLWSASGAVSTVPLPEPVFVLGITSVKARDVVVYGSRRSAFDGGPGRPYLARFDGKTLTPLEPPPEEGLSAYVEDARGTAWARAAGSESLWRREPNGGWRTVPLPVDYQPRALSVTSDGAVWVQATGPVVRDDPSHATFGMDAALLSTWAPTKVLRLGVGADDTSDLDDPFRQAK